jgi:hypothetical protein
VLRVRETHADATAAIFDESALRATIQSARAARRESYWPVFLRNHPSLKQRVAYLDDPTRLAAPDGLAMFGAGVAVSLIAINTVFLFWIGTLQHWLTRAGLIAEVIRQMGSGSVGGVMELQLAVYGPVVLLTTVVMTGLAAVTAWRARLAALPGRPPANPLRLALPWVAGIVIGPPMSVLYADAGVWGAFDISVFWQVLDVLASAVALAIIAVVVFQWAAETAAVWVPTVKRSLRRACALTVLVGTVGAFPAVLIWFLAQNTPEITSFAYAPPGPLIQHWFGAGWGFAIYDPLEYLEAVPGCGLLFAVPCLYVVIGAARRTARAPRWLSGEPDRAEVLRASRPPAGTGSPLAVGLLVGCLSVVAGLLVMLVFRASIGAAAVWAAKGAGGISMMTGWLLWLTTTCCAVAGVVVGWRAGEARLSRGMLAAFIASTWATLLLPVALYIGICGKAAYTCAVGQPQIFETIGGFIAAAAPVDGIIAAVLLLAVVWAVRRTVRAGSRLDRGTRPAWVATLGVTLAVSAVGIFAYVTNFVIGH